MCNRAFMERLFVAGLRILREDSDEPERRQPPQQDQAKIERTMFMGEYGPGQRPVLPEHRPYGPARPVARQRTILGTGFY